MGESTYSEEQRAEYRAWKSAALDGRAISHYAALDPDRPALRWRDDSIGYAALDARVNRLVRALRARGLVAGDAVAVVLGNRPEFVEVYWACLRGGWRFTPVNWHLGSDEAGYILADSGARAVVTESRFLRVADESAAGAPALDVRLLTDGAAAGWDPYGSTVASHDGARLDDPVLGSTMLYTSGTTGRPKGVQRDEPPSPLVDRSMYPQHGSVHLCTGPLYHAAPLVISMHQPLSCGATVVLMERWDPRDALARITEHRVTHTHMVPTMFNRLLHLAPEQRAAADVSSLRLVLHGAAPCPVPVKQAMIDWFGPVLVEYYSATEGFGCIVTSEEWLTHPGTVGRPADGMVVVGDPDGNPLPPGTEGTIWLRAIQPFRYRGDEEKTAAAFRGEYFTLGDVGYLDADGYLYLTDRSANLIISGGVNIYPAEVDAVLLEHPAVADVATIGVPDEDMGEAVKAVVELRDGVTPSDALAAELIGFCRDRLAHFKCPRSVDFVERLPRHDNGKLSKAQLRQAYRGPGAG